MPSGGSDDEVLLSALNHYLYCERRCALIHVEGIFRDNAFTTEGKLRHEVADTPGYESQPGARVVRALPLFSHNLRISGTADIVEFRAEGRGTPFPVEYKRGKRRQWDNDDIQLCGQALCLEEMFQTKVPAGAIFHASSKRRREVTFTEELRTATIGAIGSVRRLIERRVVPAARLRPQCDGCSLRPDCLPELDAGTMATGADRLYRIEP